MTVKAAHRDAGPESSGSRVRPIHNLLYGAVFMPISVVLLPLAVYVPPLYGEMGISLALVGTVLLVARFSDAITDPVIGWLSDRTRWRMGRRKPFMLLGTPLFMLSVWKLFVPPPDAGMSYLLLWIALVYLAATIVDLPYLTWGAELSPDYRERSKVTGVREQFHFAGTLTASSMQLFLRLVFGVTAFAVFMKVLAGVIVVLLPLTVLMAVLFVPERPPRDVVTRPRPKLRESLALIRDNDPFLRLIVCSSLGVIGTAMTASLSFMFVKHYIQAEESYSIYLVTYYLSSVLGVPIWRRLGDRLGKHKAFMISIGWFALWASFVPFIPAGYLPLFLGVMCLKGSAIGALLLLPYSMAADAIDLDTLKSGEERTGIYFAIWGMLRKFSYALGAFIALTSVEFFGFDAMLNPLLSAADGGNSQSAKIALAILYSIVPAVFGAIAIPFLWRYPLTEEKQKEIRAQLEHEIADA